MNNMYMKLSSLTNEKSIFLLALVALLLAVLFLLLRLKKAKSAYKYQLSFSSSLIQEKKNLAEKHEQEIVSYNNTIEMLKKDLEKEATELKNVVDRQIPSLFQSFSSEKEEMKKSILYSQKRLDEEKQFGKEIEKSLNEERVNNLELKTANEKLNSAFQTICEERDRLCSLLKVYNDHFTDEHGQLLDVKTELQNKKSELNSLIASINAAKKQLADIQEEIVSDTDEAFYQDYSYYKNRFEFEDSATYNVYIVENRNQQRALIKNGNAVIFYDPITTDDGLTILNKKFEKLFVSYLNAFCDNCISSVTFSNHLSMREKIRKAFDDLNTTFEDFSIELSDEFRELKIKELDLVYEQIRTKKIEQERIRYEKERQKEDAWVKKQIKEEKEALEKERQHYSRNLRLYRTKIQTAKAEAIPELKEKIQEFEAALERIDNQIHEADYRLVNERAGYVYIISNIGSFGENIYKIGMSRRLDPLERIDELSSASVPFRFDVHAMIFSEDAYALENALHSAFESRRVNLVNGRKEFYNVTLDEIETVVKKNYDKTVTFTRKPDAEQYRESIRMRTCAKKNETPSKISQDDRSFERSLPSGKGLTVSSQSSDGDTYHVHENIKRILNHLGVAFHYNTEFFEIDDDDYYPHFVLDSNIILDVNMNWTAQTLAKMLRFRKQYPNHSILPIDSDTYYDLRVKYGTLLNDFDSHPLRMPEPFIVSVVGMSYQEDQSAILDIHHGSPIYLNRVYHNQFDPLAIEAVLEDGRVIGHISADWATVLAPKLEIGIKYLTKVVSIKPKVIKVALKRNNTNQVLLYDIFE